MYYGLLMFARAAPPGSRLLATAHLPEPALRTWATLAPGGTVSVVLINDSPNRSATLAVRAPFGATATGRLTRLMAPGLPAKTNVMLAGQTFGTRTTTGDLTGAFKICNSPADSSTLCDHVAGRKRRAAHHRWTLTAAVRLVVFSR